jgi:crotonobetainyl-CoA:carnitine CoA-transferase CaiB-like acyl-CoA transferase
VHLSSPDKFWRAFATAIGRADLADDPCYRSFQDRVRHYHCLATEITPLAPSTAPPTLGEDTAAIVAELGYAPEEIERLTTLEDGWDPGYTASPPVSQPSGSRQA